MRFVIALGLLLPLLSSGQTGDFEDLVQRAQAALDTNPRQAVELYKQAVTLRPDWPEGWLYMGAGLYSLGQFGESAEALRKGTALAPNIGTGWGFLGLSEFKLNQYGEALTHIEKGEALGLGANHAFESSVRQTAALILIQSSKFDEAISQLHPLAVFGDTSEGVIVASGLCSLAMEKRPDQLTPAELELVKLAGAAQWAATSNRPADADEGFRKLLEKYPDTPNVHYAYGLYLMESDQKAALAEFDKATAASPKLWPAWLVSASLETKAGATANALRDVAKARQSAPEWFWWLCDAEAGRAHLTQKQPGLAIADFQNALKQRPGYRELHFYLSQAYERSGRTADAQREKREFVRLGAQQDPLSLTANGPAQ